MPSSSSAWSVFSARAETAPMATASGGSPYTLAVSGNGVANVYGGWRTRLQGLAGSRFYRFRASVHTQSIPSIRESVTILLRWRGAFGDEVAPTYVWEYFPQPDGSLVYDRTIQAPAATTAVDVELVLQWAPNGTVRFDALSFTAGTAPPSRPVKLAAISYRPSGTSSGLDSVQRAERFGEQTAAAERPDVMVFGELLNVIGAPGSYDALSETIPGPSTDAMAALARGYNTYVVFGMLERSGSVLYNTAVLIDRAGAIAGTHRKVQLPLAEVSGGISAGADVRVFRTDFGTVALLICQDTAFPEPARQAAALGAELLLVPIWGGKPAVTAARAIEHSVYIAASGYDYASEVLDPLGSVLARVPAPSQTAAAVATIDLAHRFPEEWSGDWRDTAGKQRRSYPPAEWTPPTGPPPPPPPANQPPAVTLTSPATGASFTAPATINLTASASDSDGAIAAVEFYAGSTRLSTSTTGPYTFTWSGIPAGNYVLTARATDNGGAATTSAAVNITVTGSPPPSTLPPPWTSQDVGAVGAPGSAAATNGVFTVNGAGADIWGTADAFQFVWQPVSGDADVVARVATVENVAAWVKAGVMIREGLTPDAAHAMMLVSAGKGLAFQRRVATAGASTSTSGIAGAAPAWVKLERRGTTITAYYSFDGAGWTAVGSDTFAMGPDVYVGLVVSSHTSSRTAAVTFDNVAVGTGLPAPWQTQDIGAVGQSGDASLAAAIFTVRGAGADVWGTADACRFVWQPLDGDGDVIARVTSVENVAAWAKAGIMMRGGLAADSPQAFMLVSAGRGLAFQRRLTAGATSVSTSGGAGTAPAWVKLERRGAVITAYRSADGVAWTMVGSDTFTVGATVYAGFAVSSHDTTRLATATFDNVIVR